MMAVCSAVSARSINETDVASEDFALLNHLRFVAMSCRSKPRSDLFVACALLQSTPVAEAQAFAEALMRCLAEALGKPARLHAPGVAELSFDEAWLAALCRAARTQDEASLRFLLDARIKREHRRLVRFLLTRVVQSVASS
jgi:hypothetical protein